MLARRLLNNINQRILQLEEEILAYDREIEAIARLAEKAKRLMAIPGIGPPNRDSHTCQRACPQTVQKRATLCRLAGPGATTILDRRQGPTWENHQARGQVPANIVDPWYPSGDRKITG